MKRLPLVIMFVLVSICAAFGLFTWIKYTHASSALDAERSAHEHACQIVAAQSQKIAELNHKLYPTGTSVTLNRGNPGCNE